MQTRVPFVAAVLALFVISAGMVSFGQNKDKAKYTIAEVMEMAHKGDDPLCKKAAGEKTSKEENQKLLELYTALSQNKPPKGDQKSWDAKTKSLVDAAKAAVAGDKGYGAKVKAAVNCMACHKAHKA
jgi:hypothetical protein